MRNIVCGEHKPLIKQLKGWKYKFEEGGAILVADRGYI